MKFFYIICKLHAYRRDHAVLFWGKNFCGYTYNLDNAGAYTEEEITRFPESHYCDDKPIEQNIVDAVAVPSVIDGRTLGRICENTKEIRELLGIKLKDLNTGRTAWDSGAFCEPKRFLYQNEHTIELIDKIKEHIGVNHAKDRI